MKKAVLIAALTGLYALPGMAQEVPALLEQKECMSCHSVDKEMRGPAFQQIAHKYKGREGAVDMLVNTVTKGSPASGGFHWGTTKMPSPGARQPVSEDEAKELVSWILSL
jgi:cytochrome c